MHPEEVRRKWQDPESILALVGLKPGMTLVDLGCGNGFFALPAARVVGTGGSVYGIDADAEWIEKLRQRAEAEGLENMTLQAGRAEETLPCEKCADVVFMGNVLHDFDDPTRVLENARKMVKPDGVLANVDWKDVPSPVGPPLAIRFAPARAQSLIEAAGFKADQPLDVGSYHYLILARPRSV
jgi:ubiquinone/menaquinone biosynthesis C-methylase UbiE